MPRASSIPSGLSKKVSEERRRAIVAEIMRNTGMARSASPGGSGAALPHTSSSGVTVTENRRRAIVAEVSSLEQQSVTPHWFFGIVTLRWILLHMIRETARHAGHLDILRELTDGRTGDD